MGEPVEKDAWSPERGPARNPTHAVTLLLDAVRHAEPGALDRLIDLVYGELHRLARRQVARERGTVTLQPTALVNEAYRRLFGPGAGSFENRRHFFGAAAQAMHRICVDYARRYRAAKRGGAPSLRPSPDGRGRRPSPQRAPDGSGDGPLPRPFHAGRGEWPAPRASPTGRASCEPAVFDRDPLEVLAVDEALARLAERDPKLVEIVRLRYFVDLSLDDTAKVLGISRRTASNRWRLARAWLCEALADR